MRAPCLFLATVTLLATATAAQAQIVNGDFESGTAPWMTQPATPGDCEAPARINCPPAEAATCGEKVANLGKTNAKEGCEFNAIYQTFSCTGTGTHCTVQFQAFYPAADSEDVATVQLGGTTRKIPVAAGWQTYKLSVAGCAASITVGFTLTGFGFPTNPIRIDNVTASCTANDQSSPTLGAGGAPVTPAAGDAPLSNLHDVPLIQELADNECGPTAAASCLQWWRANGFPDLKTRNGKNDNTGTIEQLRKDAMTNQGGAGTDLAKLTEAMNKMVNEGVKGADGAHKGQLKAKGTLANADISGFGFVDGEFAKDEDILMLVCWNGGRNCHYVTIRRITGTGATRTVEYMDPETGTVRTMTLTDPPGDGKLRHNYQGNNGTVEGFIVMSPDATATSTSGDAAGGGKKITYKVYFPPVSRYPEKQPKDMHVVVKDCNPANYQITGLPMGWSTSIAMGGDGKCYLSVFKGASANDLTNGQSIEVTYTGTMKVEERRQVLTLTTDGDGNVANGALPPQQGHTVVALTDVAPKSPSRVHAAVANIVPGSPGQMDVILAFEPPDDPSVVGFEVYNDYSGEVVASSPLPIIQIPGLSSDTGYSFSVASINLDDYRSEPTPSVFVHQLENSDIQILPGPQVLEFAPPQRSWHKPTFMQVGIANAFTTGKLIVDRIHAFPHPPHPQELRMHRPYWNFRITAVTGTEPLFIGVPYSEENVHGNEEEIQLHYFNGIQWVNVTQGVDTFVDFVFGQIPQPGPIMLVNGADPPPLSVADEYPHGARKNRYISFQPHPVWEGVQHGYEVTHAGTGQFWFISTPRNTPASVVGEGVAFLVSDPLPPIADFAALPVVHVGGCAIAPDESYEVRATSDGVNFSPPLSLSTASRPTPSNGRLWADLVGLFSAAGDGSTAPPTPANSWTPPNMAVSGFDISAALQGAASVPTAPHFTWGDLNPEIGDRVANGPDVLRVVNAFGVGTGREYYPFRHPAPSGGCAICGPGGGLQCPPAPLQSQLQP